MQIAICPGSFDPVTKGHVNIIERCARLFPQVIVVVMHNPGKSAAFSTGERADMLRLATRHIPGVEVDACEGLVSDYARRQGANVLVKGLRAMTDFEYEFQMAQVNKSLNPHLETFFTSADAEYTFCSSSAVKALARYGADLAGFVPGEVLELVSERLGGKRRPSLSLQAGGKAGSLGHIGQELIASSR